jgi:hypothetical protein
MASAMVSPSPRPPPVTTYALSRRLKLGYAFSVEAAAGLSFLKASGAKRRVDEENVRYAVIGAVTLESRPDRVRDAGSELSMRIEAILCVSIVRV